MALTLALAGGHAARADDGADAATGEASGRTGGGATLPAVHVVVLHDGDRTVMTVQPTYAGPAERFAFSVPLERAPRDGSARAVAFEVVDAVDRLGAPRLVELWERDPCDPDAGASEPSDPSDADAGATSPAKVTARFESAEYDALLAGDGVSVAAALGRRGLDAGALSTTDAGAFVAASVDAKKLVFVDGRALLSPVRVVLEGDRVVLPLSRWTAGAPADVVVSVLAKGKRYRAAGHPEVTLDTNVDVTEKARDRFADVYAALFDRTIAREPRAVVTEHAWPAGNCAPCAGPALDARDLATLGADEIPGALDAVAASRAVDDTARPRRPRYIRITPPTVDGPLPQPLIASAVLDQRARVRRCYDELLDKVPGARGGVHVSLTVAPDGQVSASSTRGSTLTAGAIDACIERIYKMFAFPNRDKPSKVAFDVTLAPIDPAAVAPPPPPGPPRAMWTGLPDWVLSRLHFRYTRESFPSDLALEEAPALSGGREGDGPAARASEAPAFQSRYVIRHPFTKPVTCAAPLRGRWGPRPGMDHPFGAIAAQRALGKAADAVALDAMLVSTGADAGHETSDASTDAGPPGHEPAAKGGCGACAVTGTTHGGRADIACILMGLAAALSGLRRRR